MNILSRIVHSIPLLYLAMLWPGRFVVQGLVWEDLYYAWMMYDSGVLTVYLLIITLSVTPALIVLRRIGSFPAVGRWLLQRRKHFGLGSFIYAALHLAHYIVEFWDLSQVLHEAVKWEFATGWAAFAIFAVLAATSNRWSTRTLGTRWKVLHRWVYPAAALSFLHWYLLDFFASRVLFWVGVLVAIKLVHIGFVLWRARKSVPSAASG